MVKDLQQRATFEDTERHQATLLGLLRGKIRKNEPLSAEERKTFSGLFSKATLSQGWRHCYYMTHDNMKIPLGSSKYLALTLLDIITPGIIITDNRTRKQYKVEISELWNVLYDMCKMLSQPALEEAIHMSKEAPKREAPGSFKFKSKTEY